jgi:hypothetical protein
MRDFSGRVYAAAEPARRSLVYPFERTAGYDDPSELSQSRLGSPTRGNSLWPQRILHFVLASACRRPIGIRLEFQEDFLILEAQGFVRWSAPTEHQFGIELLYVAPGSRHWLGKWMNPGSLAFIPASSSTSVSSTQDLLELCHVGDAVTMIVFLQN